jgi:hypothetical protein
MAKTKMTARGDRRHPVLDRDTTHVPPPELGKIGTIKGILEGSNFLFVIYHDAG